MGKNVVARGAAPTEFSIADTGKQIYKIVRMHVLRIPRVSRFRELWAIGALVALQLFPSVIRVRKPIRKAVVLY